MIPDNLQWLQPPEFVGCWVFAMLMPTGICTAGAWMSLSTMRRAALVIQPHSINQGAVGRQSEHSGFWGFPCEGSAVTLPTSTKPKPNACNTAGR